MLRTLFEAAESQGGERLSTAASLVYALAAVFIAWRAVAPVLGGVLEAAAAGAGLHRGFTLVCKSCGVRTLAQGKCEKCGATLGLSMPVRGWAALNGPGKLKRGSVSFALGVLASLVFVVATAFAALGINALSPHGVLERLFLGIAGLAWAGAAFLWSRTFSLGGVGLFARARELLFGAGALAVALSAAVLAQMARPVESKPVATLKADEGAVLVNGQKLGIENGELGLAYQLVQSPALGFNVSTPLSFVGAPGSAIRLNHDAIEDWLLEATWSRAETLNRRGFAVKRRTETFKVTPGERYEIRMDAEAPSIRPLPTAVGK